MQQEIRDFYRDYLMRVKEVEAEEYELLSAETKKVWTQHLVRKSNLIRQSHPEMLARFNELIEPFLKGEGTYSIEDILTIEECAKKLFLDAQFEELIECAVMDKLAEVHAKNGEYYEERFCRFVYANNVYLSLGGNSFLDCYERARETVSHVERLPAYQKEDKDEAEFLKDVRMIHETGFHLFDRACMALEPDPEQIVNEFNSISRLLKCKKLLPKETYDFYAGQIHSVIGTHVLFMQALYWEKLSEKRREEFRFLCDTVLCNQLSLPERERDPKLYMTYVLYCFYSGKLSADECFNLLYQYTKELPADTGFSTPAWFAYDANSRFFAVCTTTRPVLQMILASRLSESQKRQRVAEVLYDVKSYIETIPRVCACSESINFSLYHLLYNVVEFIDDESMAIEFIDTLMMNRQLATLIHTIMTAKLTQAIIDPLIDQKPELFYEVLGVSERESVFAKKEDLALFLYNAARCHDIGKIRIATVINTQIRPISNKEYDLIKEHSGWSYEILNKNPLLAPYAEIALGHHRSYDGREGYPLSYDNCHSRYRILIDILSICDSMDAATDAFGRNYTRGKTFEKVFREFEANKGTRYNPDIIDFIRSDEALFAQLKEITSKEARGDFYYHIYRKYR